MAPQRGSQGEPLDKASALTDGSPGSPATYCPSEQEITMFPLLYLRSQLGTWAPPAGTGSQTKATPDLKIINKQTPKQCHGGRHHRG